jgi:hypothetical protein
MTKEKLRRLIELSNHVGRNGGYVSMAIAPEYKALWDEFEAWDPLPERRDIYGQVIYSQPEVKALAGERDEARAAAQECFDYLRKTFVEEDLATKYPWLAVK